MKRPVTSRIHPRANRSLAPRGYTLIEILMATALMLIIMLAVAWVFGMVGESITDSRSTLEMGSSLRAASARLSLDLKGVTVANMGRAWKPRDPSADEGYFEYTEGPMGPVALPANVATNINLVNSTADFRDSTVGDLDDILMFTTRDINEAFVGQVAMKVDPVAAGVQRAGRDDYNNDGNPDDYGYVYGTIQAEAAEVAWFVRGTTLYRRVLLVCPQFPTLPEAYQTNPTPPPPMLGPFPKYDLEQRTPPPVYESLDQLDPKGFYNNDVSIRLEAPAGSALPIPPANLRMVANTLGDLTKPENRFAHRSRRLASGLPAFPFHPHFLVNWGALPLLRLEYTQWATPGAAGTPVLTGTPVAPVQGPVAGLLPGLGLPTLRECSHPEWRAGDVLPGLGGAWTQRGVFDAWTNPHPWNELDFGSGTINAAAPADPNHPPLYMGSRVGEDVILTNVINFDVKAWDPGAPILQAVNEGTTLSDVTVQGFQQGANFADDTPIPGVSVAPGDPGYLLSLSHTLIWLNDSTDARNNGQAYPPLSLGAYVDLNFEARIAWDPSETTFSLGQLPAMPHFAGPGQAWLPLMFPDPNAPVRPSAGSLSHTPRVYDTWSTHFDNNWVDMIPAPNGNGVLDAGEPGNEDGDLLMDEGANGIDDAGNGQDDDNDGYFDESDETVKNGAVDDVIEQEAPAPYPVPLRGIQIRIRVFEPESRQIREMTIVQDFVTK